MLYPFQPFSLPSWACAWLNFGFSLADLPSDRRWVLAVSVPSRAYVSCLLSAGYSIGRFVKGYSKPNGQDDSHLKWLSSLKVGTKVRYIERPLSDKHHRTSHTFQYLSTENGKLTAKMKFGDVDVATTRLQLIRDEKFNYPRESTSDLAQYLNLFLSDELSDIAIFNFLFPTAPVCCLYGKKAKIIEESDLAIQFENGRKGEKEILLSKLLSIGSQSRTRIFTNLSDRFVNGGAYSSGMGVFENISMVHRFSAVANHYLSVHILDRSSKDFWGFKDWVYQCFCSRCDQPVPAISSPHPAVQINLFEIPL